MCHSSPLEKQRLGASVKNQILIPMAQDTHLHLLTFLSLQLLCQNVVVEITSEDASY